MELSSFQPPKRLLMGPGPSPVSERVLQAMARPTIGHLDPQFIYLMDEIKSGLRTVFRTRNELTLPISGPASAAQEGCIVNLLEPGDKCVIAINGVFGGRMKMMAERAGAQVVTVEQEWGRAVDPQAVRDTLKANPDTKLFCFVHAETSTGVLSDAKALAAVAKEFGCLVLADTVTSLGGVPVEIDEWGIDACYSGTQKCLSCPPGLAPVTFSDAARKVIMERKTPVQSWFLDVSLLTSYWEGTGKRSYHHTAPVNALYALHESLLAVLEEGLETRWARHRACHEAFIAGLDTMGLSIGVPEQERTPQLNAVRIPETLDEAALRKQLLEEHNVQVGAGLGPMAGLLWRIGLMGNGATDENMLFLLDAIEQVMGKAGVDVTPGAARKAAGAV